MITNIHGDDVVSSRKYFLENKERFPDVVVLDGEKITLTDLMQIFEGGGFFDDSKAFFLEHFFAKKKKKDEFALLSEYLQKQTQHSIFLWEGKELERSAFTQFKSATPRVFKLPQTLFALLDSIKPQNGKRLISLFHQTIQFADTEMVFFMLIRQIRLLLGLIEPSTEQIDELKRLAPWQKTKLEQQARIFKKDQLLAIYHQLFLIETGQKTGSLSGTLTSNIDFLLLEI